MKLAVQKNHQILFRSLVPFKKTASNWKLARKSGKGNWLRTENCKRKWKLCEKLKIIENGNWPIIKKRNCPNTKLARKSNCPENESIRKRNWSKYQSDPKMTLTPLFMVVRDSLWLILETKNRYFHDQKSSRYRSRSITIYIYHSTQWNKLYQM